jgi:putative addiction module component (TIGR02574 family)
MTRVQELLEQVKALTPEEQEEFRLLLASEADGDFELSPEWREEIQRRVERLDSGETQAVPWVDVKHRLRERIRAQAPQSHPDGHAIIYRLRDDTATVAHAHASRQRPGYWRERPAALAPFPLSR